MEVGSSIAEMEKRLILATLEHTAGDKKQTAKLLGIDIVHFGVFVTVNLMIGLLTPPYGLLLFVTSNITKVSIGSIVRNVLPFLFMLIVALGIITFVPDVVLWLPRMFGYKG